MIYFLFFFHYLSSFKQVIFSTKHNNCPLNFVQFGVPIPYMERRQWKFLCLVNLYIQFTMEVSLFGKHTYSIYFYQDLLVEF